MNMYDFTNWHDEVKIVKDDFMLGKWCSPWTRVPLTFGPSFLSVEKGPEGSRFCLRFILNRKKSQELKREKLASTTKSRLSKTR
jgi:hypothetical protein